MILKHNDVITSKIVVKCKILLKSKVQAKQKSNEIFLSTFFASFDRVEAADHEYLLFILTKFFLPVENYEILRRYRFCQKMHLLQKCVKLQLYFFSRLLKIIFSDSESQTESRKVFQSSIDPKLYRQWSYD